MSDEELRKEFSKLRWSLLALKVSKDGVQTYLFKVGGRDELTRDALTMALYQKCRYVDEEDARRVARWVFENAAGSGGGGQVTQRKVCKVIVDRILTPAMYEVISEREEKLMISKIRELASNLKLSEGQLEVAFGLYDLDESGVITIDDLREGLTSLELYTDPVRDRKLFLAFGLRLLALSPEKKALEVNISDVVEVLGGGSPDFQPINRLQKIIVSSVED